MYYSIIYQLPRLQLRDDYHVYHTFILLCCLLFWLFSELSFWFYWKWFGFKAIWKSRNLGGSYFLWWFSWLWSNTDSSETCHSPNDFRSIHIFTKEFTKLLLRSENFPSCLEVVKISTTTKGEANKNTISPFFAWVVCVAWVALSCPELHWWCWTDLEPLLWHYDVGLSEN